MKNGAQWDRQYIDTRVLADVSDNTMLYNIPVYNIDGLDYGTYHIYVYIYKQGTPLPDGATSCGEFYLDSIRVYNPMGTESDNVDGYTTAASAYTANGEPNVSIFNIRAKILADVDCRWSGTEFTTLTDVDVRIKPLVQPVVVHDLLNFSQQVVFRHQCLNVDNADLCPGIFSLLFHMSALPFLLLYTILRNEGSFLTS